MALISDLVTAIAEAEGLPEATVGLVARYTREAGYLSQGARGRNAPRATITDAANLIIALNAGGCVAKDAPQAVERYRDLICHAPHSFRSTSELGTEYGRIKPDELRFLDRHASATFGELLESAIDRFVGGELEMFMKGQASEFLGSRFFEETMAEVGNDAKAIATRVGEATDRLLNLGTVAFTLEFHRPNAFARILVERSGEVSRDRLAGVSFIVDADTLMSGQIKQFDGDRSERTKIGYPTLKKVADVLRKS